MRNDILCVECESLFVIKFMKRFVPSTKTESYRDNPFSDTKTHIEFVGISNKNSDGYDYLLTTLWHFL